MATLINAIAPRRPIEHAGNGHDFARDPASDPLGDAAPVAAPTVVAAAKTHEDIEDEIADAIAVASTPAADTVSLSGNDWQPIATAPYDRNVQVGVNVRSGIMPVFYPCRRTESGWTNAVVKAPLLPEPIYWREWRETYFEV